MTTAHRLPRRGTRLSSLFTPFPFVCFILTLGTDMLYWLTANLMWLNFSSWLLLAAMVLGALALITGLIDFLRASTRYQMGGFAASLGFVAMMLLGLVNNFIHARDGWTAVVPIGLGLSAFTVVIAIVTFAMAASHRSHQEWRVVQ